MIALMKDDEFLASFAVSELADDLKMPALGNTQEGTLSMEIH